MTRSLAVTDKPRDSSVLWFLHDNSFYSWRQVYLSIYANQNESRRESYASPQNTARSEWQCIKVIERKV